MANPGIHIIRASEVPAGTLTLTQATDGSLNVEPVLVVDTGQFGICQILNGALYACYMKPALPQIVGADNSKVLAVTDTAGTLDYVALAGSDIGAATSSVMGAVKITGTPASAGGPIVPAIEADTFIPESALDIAVIGPSLPAGTSAARGVVRIVGTPADATNPIVPVKESGGVAGTTGSPATVTTASLVGNTLTFVNGLLVSITPT